MESKVNTSDDLQYFNGFGNTFESEALKGALPISRNNPQKCAFGLYAEQLNGTSFTIPRNKNQKSWLYRILPTVGHKNHTELKIDFPLFVTDFDKDENITVTPDQFRWKTFPFPKENEKIDFLHGIHTFCGAGSPALKVIISTYYQQYLISKNKIS